MQPELSEQQRQAIEEQGGSGPVKVIDSASNREYVLLGWEEYEQLRSPTEASGPRPSSADVVAEVPLGIRLSQEAMRWDLPKLLEQKKLVGQWIAYHRDERIGIARKKSPLIRECLRRGLDDDEFYVGKILPHFLIEEEELGPPRPSLMVDEEEEATQ